MKANSIDRNRSFVKDIAEENIKEANLYLRKFADYLKRYHWTLSWFVLAANKGNQSDTQEAVLKTENNYTNHQITKPVLQIWEKKKKTGKLWMNGI